jgi:hypothetical protein
VRDQHTYTAEQMFRHITCVWEQWYQLRPGDPSETRSRADPGIQPDLPVIVADIRRAWERARLDSTERQIFVCRNFWGMDLGTIAEVYDLTPQQVADALDVSTEELLATINGIR